MHGWVSGWLRILCTLYGLRPRLPRLEECTMTMLGNNFCLVLCKLSSKILRTSVSRVRIGPLPCTKFATCSTQDDMSTQ